MTATKKELNPFNFQMIEDSTAPKKQIKLTEMLRMVLGHPGSILSGSKRLLPAMAISNSRIYTGNLATGKLFGVWRGDLDFYKQYPILGRIAEVYGVTLHVFYESGQKPVWTSVERNAWLGHVPEKVAFLNEKLIAQRKKLGLPYDEFVNVVDVFPFYQAESTKQIEQWKRDHGWDQKTKHKGAKVVGGKSSRATPAARSLTARTRKAPAKSGTTRRVS